MLVRHKIVRQLELLYQDSDGREKATISRWFVHAQKKIYRHIETVDLAIHMSRCSRNQGWGSGKGVSLL